MANTGSLSTSLSLIARAKTGDSAAWDTMADLYGPLVYRWARRGGLQDSDAADLMQDVFQDVVQGLDGFRKQNVGSFRGWLWVITRNRLRRHYKTLNSRPAAFGGSDANLVVQQLPDSMDSDDEPDNVQTTTALVHRAWEIVRADFEPHTWQACWRLAVSGHSAAEIGRELGMSEKAVRQAKYRIMCRLRQILGDD